MKTYTVSVLVKEWYLIEVEAESRDEALLQAEEEYLYNRPLDVDVVTEIEEGGPA